MNWLNTMFSGAQAAPTAPLNADVLLLDVRNPDEFASGHVQGSINIPLSLLPLKFTEIAPDKARQIVAYCRSGARSGMAQQFLQGQGYEKVINGGSVESMASMAGRNVVR